MSLPIRRGARQLRRGRVSIAGATYFVTTCAAGRAAGLDRPEVAGSIAEALRELHREGSIRLLCATVMPDHLHALYVLGARLSLAGAQSKLKSLTKKALAGAGLSWQANFFEHRLRSDASTEPFSRYIFLNPYRKGLLSPEALWPWWMLSKTFRPEFLEQLEDNGGPPRQWIGERASAADLVAADR